LFSAALRLSGVVEGSGRFVGREGANLWVKTTEGRVGLPVDPELPLARKVGDRYFPSASLTLRAGDRLRWWKRGAETLGIWVEWEAAGRLSSATPPGRNGFEESRRASWRAGCLNESWGRRFAI